MASKKFHHEHWWAVNIRWHQYHILTSRPNATPIRPRPPETWRAADHRSRVGRGASRAHQVPTLCHNAHALPYSPCGLLRSARSGIRGKSGGSSHLGKKCQIESLRLCFVTVFVEPRLFYSLRVLSGCGCVDRLMLGNFSIDRHSISTSGTAGRVV